MILAAMFTVLTAAGAFLRIPMPVSSFTLQLLFTALAGLLLGRKWGAVSQAVYVLLGLAGLPVFTFGGGMSALAQPTFGFLLGMIPMAWVIGFAAERRSPWLVCLIGLMVLYLIGLPYMHIILTWYLGRPWSLWQTVWSGMVLFLPWDGIKLAAAVILYRRLRKILPRS